MLLYLQAALSISIPSDLPAGLWRCGPAGHSSPCLKLLQIRARTNSKASWAAGPATTGGPTAAAPTQQRQKSPEGAMPLRSARFQRGTCRTCHCDAAIRASSRRAHEPGVRESRQLTAAASAAKDDRRPKEPRPHFLLE